MEVCKWRTIQVIPADSGWVAVYESKDESKEKEQERRLVVVWLLQEEIYPQPEDEEFSSMRVIAGIVTEYNGEIEAVDEQSDSWKLVYVERS